MMRPIQGSGFNPLTSTNVEQPVAEKEKETKSTSPPASKSTQSTQNAPADGSTASQKSEHSFLGNAVAASLNRLLGSPSSPSSSPASSKTTSTDEPKTLKVGDSGSAVESLQKKLNEWRSASNEKPVQESGNYSNETSIAIHDFQKKSGLTADGEAGPKTHDRLALETDPNFKKMNDDAKGKVRDLMNHHSPLGIKDLPDNQSTRTNLMEIATDPNFAKLSPEGQTKTLDRFKTNPTDKIHAQSIRSSVKDRAKLEGDSKFQHLQSDTKTQILNKLEDFHGKPAERANLIQLATDGRFSKISRMHQEQTLNIFGKNPSDSKLTGVLQDITGNERFRNMDDALKTRVLNMVDKNSTNPIYTEKLERLVTGIRFGDYSTQDQGRLLNVFENTTPDGRDALQNLLKREVDKTPALKTRGYGDTGTLIEQLDRLSTSNLDGRLKGTDRSKVTETLLQELGDPDHYVDQGSYRMTCTVANMSHGLALKQPAEYARLVTDLSTTGEAVLANGDMIQPPADAWPQDHSKRSPGERLLQSSLMHYAKPDAGYRNQTPGRDGKMWTKDDNGDRFSDGARGLKPKEEQRVLQGLHGREFEVYKGDINARNDAKDILDRTKEELDKGNKPIHTGFVDHSWGHAVQVTEIRDGRVYFRNPHGGYEPGVDRGVGPRGKDPDDPNEIKARTEKPWEGIQSVTVEEYLQIVDCIILPR